jgi:precorrin-2 dehydrogenase/sirohydrochlorin ferrochelatase
MPPLYPLFLDLSRINCLVVGGGKVGGRKARALLDGGARHVLVLDPGLRDPRQLPAHPRLSLETRAFRPEDLAGRMLVFAAAGDRGANAAVAAACAEAGVFCNCADAPEEGNFFAPAAARAGNITLALSTGGANPAYARLLREQLEEWLKDKAAPALLLGRIRPRLLALRREREDNARVLETLARAPLDQALAAGDGRRCRELLERALPESLHPCITEFLDGLL